MWRFSGPTRRVPTNEGAWEALVAEWKKLRCSETACKSGMSAAPVDPGTIRSSRSARGPPGPAGTRAVPGRPAAISDMPHVSFVRQLELRLELLVVVRVPRALLHTITPHNAVSPRAAVLGDRFLRVSSSMVPVERVPGGGVLSPPSVGTTEPRACDDVTYTPPRPAMRATVQPRPAADSKLMAAAMTAELATVLPGEPERVDYDDLFA